MIEVLNQEGAPTLVYHPWSAQELRQLVEDLPNPEGNGAEYSRQLPRFCREVRPSFFELRRLLTLTLKSNFYKVSQAFGEEHLTLVNPLFTHADNARYRDALTVLQRAFENAFSLHLDMNKVSSCKQEDDEKAATYLARLRKVYEAHSEMKYPMILLLPSLHGSPI